MFIKPWPAQSRVDSENFASHPLLRLLKLEHVLRSLVMPIFPIKSLLSHFRIRRIFHASVVEFQPSFAGHKPPRVYFVL